MIFINAVAFAVLLSISVGPVFFSLIQTSIAKGFNKGVLVAIGINLSDITYILLAYFGIASLLENPDIKALVGYIGGGILVAFGVVALLKKVSVETPKVDEEIKGFFRFIIKGFFINGLSPFVLIFWLGAMSLATVEYGYEGNELALFFGVILMIVLSADIGKAYLANKLRKFVTVNVMKKVNIIAGLALIAFGFRMLLYSW